MWTGFANERKMYETVSFSDIKWWWCFSLSLSLSLSLPVCVVVCVQSAESAKRTVVMSASCHGASCHSQRRIGPRMDKPMISTPSDNFKQNVCLTCQKSSFVFKKNTGMIFGWQEKKWFFIANMVKICCNNWTPIQTFACQNLPIGFHLLQW